ncbi:hypothetical protein [Sphaerisporangium fuscum]|uniref:hypothetical protein n=1 Tax=Sphaerisporangium fuscum TaxID=2835868 RepID=UPI001BDCB581|nr:hypothetical protein [Sphaerisporangium fuscum]
MNKTMRVALSPLLLAGLLAGCSAGGSADGRLPTASSSATTVPAAATSPSATPDGPAVTLAEAGQEARKILKADEIIRAFGAESYALAQTADAQRQVTVADFQSTAMRPARYTWGDPTLLVPRLEAGRYPYWFAAVAERRDAGGTSRTAVLAFMKSDERSRWQLRSVSLLYPGTKPPAITLDSEGYATALATRDESVAISPRLMAPLHATIAEEGPKGYAAQLITAGPQTTGYFAEVQKAQPAAKRQGLLYDSIFAATPYPIYALRAAGGGAVIIYSLRRTTSLQGETVSASGLVPVPKAVRWAVDHQAARVARKLRVVETQQYVSQVARKGATDPAKIIAFDGTPTTITVD